MKKEFPLKIRKLCWSKRLQYIDNEIWAVEIKRASAPKLSRGFYEACKDIQATHKWIVNAQEDQYPLTNEIEVIGLREFLKQITSKNEFK